MPKTLAEVNREQQEVAVVRWRQAKALTERGMTMEDAGRILGISKARIWQMLQQLAKYEADHKNGAA